ncbi:LAETG motif-containing sortase-dependent surface protein [Streptomyces sp. NPDC058632]|uniref:LAETG motif-containing sortase-dependent surface protein n=1 Tax=unclassified Streptomyces TaxID=2593676 RepID=UPI0036468759
MNLSCKSAAVTVAALALAALPAASAVAHEGAFKNCSEAYAAGYANIPAGSEHYGEHLDRDGDGIGCDKPPAGFVPADDKDEDTGSDTGTGTETGTKDPAPGTTEQGGTDLAETGGSSATPYLAAGGAAVVLAGGGVLFAARRRRSTD